MRKNWLLRFFAVFVSLVLVFAAVGVGIGSAASSTEPIKLAQLYGVFDLSSSEVVTVIVELESISMLEAKHTGRAQNLNRLALERNRVIGELEKLVEVSLNREYAHVFSGMSISIPANAIPGLLAISGVKAVYPNVEYTVTSPEVVEPGEVTPDMFKTAPYIGAARVWNELGYTGSGIVVAVIDTGVDYTHPDLAPAFGDYKGWDFVDNDNDPQETPPGDPRGAQTTHGTHVAGTIAANGALVGIAPNATLLAYRVLGPGGSGSTTNVVAGIERAVLDGAHIMNLSLGNTLNNPDWATSLALDRAMEDGVVAVTSNGNNGPNNWTVGSPGTSRRAISVGATELPKDFFDVGMSTAAQSYPTFKLMGYTSNDDMMGLDGNDYEFVYVGLGGPEDFVGLDMTGKVALIQRGVYAFTDKALNAANAGAVAAIIFNNAFGEIGPTPSNMVIPTFKLSNADGVKMYFEMVAGNNIASFSVSHLGKMESIADFSSRGPVTLTWMIKPDVSAPGVDIVSTIPTHNPAFPHAYASYQGTSMAAPHVAGAAALILQAHPGWGVDDVKSALMNTADVLTNPYTGQFYPHNTQGAGSIRVYEAIQTKTLVNPSSYSFGKFITDKIQVETQKFEIKNLSNQRVRYSIDIAFDGNPDGIKVTSSNNLNVQPGRTQRVNMVVRVDASKLSPGYYEGTISISNGSEVIRIPTILFVGEPDYPRITGAFFGNAGDGTYYVGSYLPGGAEILEYDMYHFNADAGTIGPFLGTIGEFADVPAPFHEFTWDGKISGVDLPNGQYVLAVWVLKAGVIEYKAYLVTKN